MITLFTLTHYLEAWLLPPGLNLFFIIVGCLLFHYSRVIGSLLLILGVVSLWALSAPFFAYQLVDMLQNQYSILQENDLQNPGKHTAIVVLGGGELVEAEYEFKKIISDFTMHRLKYGVYLHQKTGLPLILSGGNEVNSTQSGAQLMADFLRDNYQISANFIEDKSRTTAEESQLLRPILKKNNFDKIYLVTNAWHMPRSISIFKCAGINAIPAPMGYFIYGPGYSLISFFPNSDALAASTIALHELIGSFWYQIRYHQQCV